MRWLHFLVFALLVGASTGCPVSVRDTANGGDDDGNGSGGGFDSRCFDDIDCVPAAASCCDCPTFAVPRNDPAHQACDGVPCPDPMESTCPNNVSAVCNAGRCELSCAKQVCAKTCADGYQRDTNGCLSCECATPANECSLDNQCVETRADCCGCKLGGDDTAVLATNRAAFDSKLACPVTPSCPGVDTCKADQAPRCIQGACALVDRQLPQFACGRNDLPACPTGQVCLLNAVEQANSQGVGVCSP